MATVYGRDGWAEKTMSALREKQLEACEERLGQFVGAGLFGRLTALDYGRLWSNSFFAQEESRAPSQSALRARVLRQLQNEAALLSRGEHELLERMLAGGGVTRLSDFNQVGAAEALAQRFWCTVKVDGGNAYLLLAPPLIGPLREALCAYGYAKVRSGLFSFDATLHALMYLTGFLEASAPAARIGQMLGTGGEQANLLAMRYLRASFSYTLLPGGETLLVHPGLAEPEKLLRSLCRAPLPPEGSLTGDMILGGMNGMLQEEAPASNALRGMLSDAPDGDADADETVSDLRILIKQGAPYPEVEAVLSARIRGMPSARMKDALKTLYRQTVRWAGASAQRLN